MKPVSFRADELVPHARDRQPMAFFSDPGKGRTVLRENKRLPERSSNGT